MDLGAYANIDRLEKLVKANGIDVPRLRGYRLMKNETPVNITELFNNIEVDCCDDLVEYCWGEDCGFWWGDRDRKKKRYMTYHTDTLDDGRTIIIYDKVKWENIHGKHRRTLKFAVKKAKKARLAQFETFNKYCGRDDILYIHSRIGGGNWSYYYKEVVDQPWFIEKVDDSFDSTYCDIYAKLTVKEIK